MHILSWRFCSLVLLTSIGIASAQPRPAHLELQMGHPGGIEDVRFSPDGRLALTLGNDFRACLWDLASGKELRCLEPPISSVRFSPTESTMLVASPNGAVLRDVNTGDELRRFGDGMTQSAVFSADGDTIAAIQGVSVHIWDTHSGKEINRLHEPAWDEIAAKKTAFKPLELPASPFIVRLAGKQDRLLLTCSYGDQVALWDRFSGQLIRKFPIDATLKYCEIAPDGSKIAAMTIDLHDFPNGTIFVKVFSVASGAQLWSRGTRGAPDGLSFSPDSLNMAYSSRAVTQELVLSEHIVDSQNGTPNDALEKGAGDYHQAFFDQSGTRLATIDAYNRISARWVGAARSSIVLEPKVGLAAEVCWNGKTISVASPSGWSSLDVQDGHISRTSASLSVFVGRHDLACDGPEPVAASFANEEGYLSLPSREQESKLLTAIYKSGNTSFEISANGRFIAFTRGDNVVHVVDTLSAKEVNYTTSGSVQDVLAVSVSGRYVLCQLDKGFSLADVTASRQIATFKHDLRPPFIGSASFYKDELVAFTSEHGVGLYSIPERRLLWEERKQEMGSTVFSGDGHFLAIFGSPDSWRIVNVETGEAVQRFEGHAGPVASIAFSPDFRTAASGGTDGTVRLWDTASGKELARYVSLSDGAWAVVDPAGRYDASDPDGVDGLHWVVDTDVISLKQLKQRFYVPGLLAKVVRRDKLPDVADLHLVDLFPGVQYQPPATGSTKLEVTLQNRGGGIGRMKVLVNGKEVVADARGPAQDPNAPQAHLTIDLAGAPVLPGERNVINVISSNAKGYLESRGFVTEWIPPGQSGTASPELYAIVVGTSEYRDAGLRLRYSAKDADDMATAIRLAAKRLFGAERVHLTTLESPGRDSVLEPTKLNIERAFESARSSKPGDILFVYFSGHAVTLGGGQDRYCYLTVDGRVGDFSDPATRDRSCVTSDELGEWITKIPALKQVLILDTCAAGAVADRFTLPRDLGADQIRAMELLKDRSGVHILMGSAADAVSYESNQYGQGLLTFSLLEAMRGAALKEGRYVDVSTWFNWATDRVPVLAKDIGGIQRPLITAPKGTSFPIGMVLEDDKEHIPLARIKPEIVRPSLQNSVELYDDLKLTAAVRDRLRDLSEPVRRGAGRNPNIVYLDIDESLPGAIVPRGVYRVDGTEVRVTIRLIRDGAPIRTIDVEGTVAALPELAELICRKILAAISAPN